MNRVLQATQTDNSMSMSLSQSTVSSTIAKSPWYSKRFLKTQLDSEIPSIAFVAHAVTTDDALLPNPTNHWSAFLQISDNSSVRMEVSPTSGGGEPGTVVIESKEYDMSTHRNHAVVVAVAPGTTVAKILSLLIELKRDRYVFSKVGEGCRFWLFTLAGDFASKAIISQEHAETVRRDIQLYWPPTAGEPQPREMSVGQFPDSGK